MAAGINRRIVLKSRPDGAVQFRLGGPALAISWAISCRTCPREHGSPLGDRVTFRRHLPHE